MAGNSKFLRLSNAGIQMGILIGGGAWLGNYLDKKYLFEKPIWTIILSLLGIAIGLYVIIKEVLQISKDEDGDGENKK